MLKHFDLISWLLAGTLLALLIAPVERVTSITAHGRSLVF
jgi:hypothetical protein